jgi:hypothetical protein
MLLCECGWKEILDSDLSGAPTELKNDTMSSRKFRCPKCGFAITPRPAADPQSELRRKLEEERAAEENRRWLEESERQTKEFMEKVRNGQEDNAE